MLVIRHGERIDFTFNREHQHWVRKAFESPSGKYTRFDINMPRSMPTRAKDGPDGFVMDTPLTEIGYLQAKITGRALKDAGVSVSHVYCSSALRCVQTTVGILKGMGDTKSRINVEPGLFEWGSWFKQGIPSWMDPAEFLRLGYPVNVNYTPLVKPVGGISQEESLVDYYTRSYDVARRILARHPTSTPVGGGVAAASNTQENSSSGVYVNLDAAPNESASSSPNGPVILMVAHGASLDTLTRQLTGGAPRDSHSFFNILHSTPYLACTQVIERWMPTAGHQSGGVWRWQHANPPILPFQHCSNNSYDATILRSPAVEDEGFIC